MCSLWLAGWLRRRSISVARESLTLCRVETWSSRSQTTSASLNGRLTAVGFLFIQVVYRSVPSTWQSRSTRSPQLHLMGPVVEGSRRPLHAASRFCSVFLCPLALTAPIPSLAMPCFALRTWSRRDERRLAQRSRLVRTGLTTNKSPAYPRHQPAVGPSAAGHGDDDASESSAPCVE